MEAAPSGASVILAVDLGTTSAKVLAVRSGRLTSLGSGADGLIAARAERGYPLLSPKPGYAEQDPDLIARSVEEAVREAVEAAGCGPSGVLAVSFSTAMHALIAVDATGRALTPSITWADLRAAKHARRLRESGEGAAITARTGVPVHAMTPLAKLLWLQEREPELFRQAHRFVGIKEYVLSRWFDGIVPMDESVAGGTALYGLHTRSWDAEALALAGIGEDKLPPLAPATHVLRGMRTEAAAALGLHADVPIVLGAADGVLANLGAGAMEPGIAAITIGTSGAVRLAVKEPAADPKGRLFCYPLADGWWVAGGPVNSGGVVLRWLKEQLAPDLADNDDGEDGYSRLVRLALEVPPGAGGLIFLPHLSGERAPHWDERARGVYFGLSLDHDRRHMLRAGIEGILLGLRSVLQALSETAGTPREIRVSGGFSRSAPLRQLMADVLGLPIVMTDSEDSSAIGAGLLALRALGMSGSLTPEASGLQVTDRCEPEPAAAAIYAKLHDTFRRLYERSAPSFAELDELRETK
jgi:gluconokinase